MKDSIHRIISRLNNAKERSSRLEARPIKKPQSKTQREKKKKKQKIEHLKARGQIPNGLAN